MNELKEMPATYNVPKFIDTNQLAELISVNQDTARRLCRDGRLEAIGVTVIQTVEAGDYRISRQDIEARIGNKGAISVTEAAERLAVTPQTIKNWLKAGKLTGIKIGQGRGTLWRVSVEKLESLTK